MNIFLTGGNRGLGLHLLKKLVPGLKPNKVFVTFRDPAKAQELQDFAQKNPQTVELVQLDLKDFESYDSLPARLPAEGLHLLINNAGVSSKVAKLSAVRRAELLDNWEVNTLAPILLTKALLPLLEKGAKTKEGERKAAVVNFSSILGSIEQNDQGGMYAYRCSKAALNAATKSMSLDFRKSGIIAVALHPGWVRTDMGGPKAPLSPDEATSSILSFLQSLGPQHNGGFFQYDGKRLPW